MIAPVFTTAASPSYTFVTRPGSGFFIAKNTATISARPKTTIAINAIARHFALTAGTPSILSCSLITRPLSLRVLKILPRKDSTPPPRPRAHFRLSAKTL